jgi:hypothetical protein
VLYRLTDPKGPLIDVFVGEGLEREFVISIPAPVLQYFSPKHRLSLPANKGNPALVLPNCCNHAVKWIMNWMVLGGMEKEYEDTSLLTMSSTDRVLNRLQVVTEFEIGGDIYNILFSEFTELVITGAIQAVYLVDVFNLTPYRHIKAMFEDLAWSIVENHLNGVITTRIAGITYNPLLAPDLRFFLSTQTNRIHARQRIDKIPIYPLQLNFIYSFTESSSPLRKMAVIDLFDLIHAGKVTNENEYNQWAAEYAEFKKDVDVNTIEKAARETANK